MKIAPVLLAALLAGANLCVAVDAPSPAPAKPALKITPGKVVIPFERMRRIWGELISLDLETRTGKFRKEDTNEVMSFTVMPYAELLHHATLGDLQDFRVGERAIFRLHENEAGEWVWLTYIQDEMNMMNGHKEYFYVDSLDADKRRLTCTQANFDQSFIREKNITIETDGDTRFWKGGQPAGFDDINIGDKVRTKTHGVGQGKVRVAWEVFLDDESLLKFQAEQKAVHAARIKEQGAPGYVDEAGDGQLQLTLFAEGVDEFLRLKPGAHVRVAPAGVNRAPTATAITGTVASAQTVGKECRVTLTATDPTAAFQPTGLARLWAAE